MAAADATTPTSAEPHFDASDSEKPSASTPNIADDDEDDEDVVTSRRRGAAKSAAEVPDPSIVNGGEMNDADEEDDDAGLFGSGDDSGQDGADSRIKRKLDDPELDSGDDLEREDRANGDGEDGEDNPLHTYNIISAEMGAHPVPDPTDGELYLLKVPKFLGFESHAFDASTFKNPTTDLHSKLPSEDFSAHQTSMNTMRWREDPSDPTQFQSNARILRWSDGSLTLQMATNPATQYLMNSNSLSKQQHNPPKPTPTSTGKGKPASQAKAIPYDVSRDSFTFLSAPSEQSALLRVTNKFTTGLTVQPSQEASKVAVERMRANYEKTEKETRSLVGANGHLEMEIITVDPERARREAEYTEKEQEKAQRKRENQELKAFQRRAGGGTRRNYGRGAGASHLDGDDELGAGVRRERPGARGPRQRRTNRGEIYSDDEEEAWGQRGRTREDEYDEDDGFLVGSDDEEEGVAEGDDDEDIDEGIVLKESRSRKRASPTDEQDADGESDEDEAAAKPGEASPTSRTKRRRVIDDEDED